MSRATSLLPLHGCTVWTSTTLSFNIIHVYPTVPVIKFSLSIITVNNRKSCLLKAQLHVLFRNIINGFHLQHHIIFYFLPTCYQLQPTCWKEMPQNTVVYKSNKQSTGTKMCTFLELSSVIFVMIITPTAPRLSQMFM